MRQEAFASTAATTFLQALAADPHEPLVADRLALVVAHPDDETIGIGGQLSRLHGIKLVHVTDGSPRQDGAAEAHGFATREDYAAARREELRAAMAVAGVPEHALVGLGIADQDASFHLVEIARRLATLFREQGIELVLTHAFEGGHPDHDATAFAAHAAGALLHHEGSAPALIEMP